MFRATLSVCLILIFLCSCKQEAEICTKKQFYGLNENIDSVFIYQLSLSDQLIVEVVNQGAAIKSIQIPDKTGLLEDITLGFRDEMQYLDNTYYGTVVGRFANRIDSGKIVIDSIPYQLSVNTGKNHLHGGKMGFNKVYWKGQMYQTDSTAGVKFYYLSKDEEEGYPGNLKVEIIYEINLQNELVIEYHGTTDQPTIVNLSNHTIYNLGGISCKDILGHQLKINAAQFTPVDSNLIPTGEIAPVIYTPFDFITHKTIGEDIDTMNSQLKFCSNGYDHNWVLNKQDENGLTLAADVFDPVSGRGMKISTTEPGLQFYSGNFFYGRQGKYQKEYIKYAGFALEPQHFPDSPNHKNFPSVILRPGQKYYQKSIHTFYVAD